MFMHIIAMGWIYVVSMMAFMEKSIMAGISTFTFYCALPLAVVWYITRGRNKKAPQRAEHQDLDKSNEATVEQDITKIGVVWYITRSRNKKASQRAKHQDPDKSNRTTVEQDITKTQEKKEPKN